jgi:hypothetical protein
MKLDSFIEQVFFSTIRITTPSRPGQGESIGTGFIFRVPVGDKGKTLYLLISNKHVFRNPSGPINLSFHQAMSDDSDSGPDIGQVITIADNRFDDVYVPHPDPSVDLACINIVFAFNQNHMIYCKNIHPDVIASFMEDDLLPGSDVWFVGYPENRFDTVHNLPLLRKGCIASIPTVDFNDAKEFVIDAQVFPGSSGSPVFGILGGKYKLLGVVSQTMLRNNQLQKAPVNTLFTQEIIGLGLVIKATLVKELVDIVVQGALQAANKQGAPVDSPGVA